LIRETNILLELYGVTRLGIQTSNAKRWLVH
jgi:hypothetical protein